MSTLSEAVRDFLIQVEEDNCTSGTLRRYASELTIWQQWRSEQHLLDDSEVITTEELRRFFSYLQCERIPHATNTMRPAAENKGLSANSRDGYYRLLHSFLRWCVEQELLEEQQVQFSRIPRPKVEQVPRETYCPQDIERLIRACDDSDPEARYRNQAIILMLLESGTRVNELCGLTDELVDLDKRRACIRGKGGKYRYMFWFDETTEALFQYLRERRGGHGGALFRSLTSVTPKALAPNGVRGLFRRLSQISGVHLADGAPIHALRHTFAHRMLERGADISQVSQMLGHSSIEITMRYLRESPTQLQHIYEQVMKSKP